MSSLTEGGGNSPLSLLRRGLRLGEGTTRLRGLGDDDEAGELTTNVGGGGLRIPSGFGERGAALAIGEALVVLADQPVQFTKASK